MTALNDRFWAKVLFSQFIKHYRKMNDEQIVADIKQSMDDLEDLIDEGDSFGAKMVRWSMERVDQYPQARENGKKGGRPRKNPEETTAETAALDSQGRTGVGPVRGGQRIGSPARPPVRSGRKFRNKEEFIQWAIDTGLDPDDAGNCWEATMERGGLTKDGKKVENICAYAVKWCRTSKKNRETA